MRLYTYIADIFDNDKVYNVVIRIIDISLVLKLRWN